MTTHMRVNSFSSYKLQHAQCQNHAFERRPENEAVTKNMWDSSHSAKRENHAPVRLFCVRLLAFWAGSFVLWRSIET